MILQNCFCVCFSAYKRYRTVEKDQQNPRNRDFIKSHSIVSSYCLCYDEVTGKFRGIFHDRFTKSKQQEEITMKKLWSGIQNFGTDLKDFLFLLKPQFKYGASASRFRIRTCSP